MAAPDPAWLKLLFYQKDGDGYRSLVENESFFLSDGGQTNPEREYLKSIELFNQKEDKTKCVFPARFMFLEKKGLVRGSLRQCKAYQEFLSDVQPKAVTLLFTNAYMSNPSSLFGHTLFRIDTKREGTQLLAHGVNFGADTGDDAGVLYALKGLWGGYYGGFAVQPYYDIINLYNNIENRDIWEYGLNFDADELALLTAHLWEMKEAKIRYYFAARNCSNVLLLMLEGVKPELELSEEFGFYTVPLESLKAVNDVPGLVGDVRYRPSRQSKLKYRAQQMNKRQYAVFLQIINGGDLALLDKLSDEERADVLETAYQYVQYRYVEGKLELADYRRKSFALLSARSKIAGQRQYFDELKEGENPVEAGKRRQAGIILGAKNGKMFQEVMFRPLYNSLLDDSYGLLKGAEINLFATKIRHYDGENKYVLSDFEILSIKSLAGADAMFRPISYDLSGGIKRVFDPKDGKEHMAATLDLAAGQSYAIVPDLLIYAMSGPNAAYGGGLNHKGYAAWAFKAGAYYNRGRVRLNVEAKQNFATDYTARGQVYTIEAGLGLTRNVMLYGGYRKFNADKRDDEEVSLGIKFGF